MAPPQPMTKPLRKLIFQVSQQGQSVCDRLERGQADTPLSNHFQQIERDIDSAPFSVVLLGLTTEARTAALAWLYGKDFSVLSVNAVQQLGLVEISLRERGYTLEKNSGERLEFDRLDPFMEALQKSDVLSPHDGENWVDPVRLGVNTSRGLQGLTVYMPESPAMILKNTGLLNRIVTRANLLVVAAPLNHNLSDADQQAILEVSQNMDGFWPLLVVDELQDNAEIPQIGWWQKHSSPTVQLKPQLLTTHVTANIPNLLQDIDDQTRQSLFLFLQARRTIHASEAVDERCQQELRQLHSRKNREQRKSATEEQSAASSGTTRSRWDNLRTSLIDNIQQIDKRLQDNSKKALLPNSRTNDQLEQLLSRLQITDLDKEPGHKTIKLSVKDSFLDELKNQLGSTIKQRLKADTTSLQDQLNQQQQTIEQQVSELTNQPHSLPLVAPQWRDIWTDLKQQINVSLNYRGEMPKRGFMARLSDGRRAIMGISIMAMVIGGVFKALWDIDFRALIMLVAPLIFIGSVLYSYIVWPKEDAERLDKELDRVRDGISSELKRLLSELHREKHLKITDHLDTQKKNLQRRLDELMRNTAETQEQTLTLQRTQARARIQQIDTQIRDLQAIERDITSLKRTCSNLEREGKQQLAKL